jgi:hypothetical protein
MGTHTHDRPTNYPYSEVADPDTRTLHGQMLDITNGAARCSRYARCIIDNTMVTGPVTCSVELITIIITISTTKCNH